MIKKTTSAMSYASGIHSISGSPGMSWDAALPTKKLAMESTSGRATSAMKRLETCFFRKML